MQVDPRGYRARVVDGQVERYLRLFGAVVIEGTKWCGKTWTSRHHAQSITFVDRGSNLDIALADPAALLVGERPHVIDEWQRAPELWNVVRHAVDDLDGEKGAWILTGSSTPLRDASRHSGAGRFGRIKMLPMSLCESGASDGSVSLAGLFRGEFSPVACDMSLDSLLAEVVRGGWPESLGLPAEDAAIIPREYIRAVLEESVPNANRSGETARRLLNSLARNLGQSATYKTLARDMYGEDAVRTGDSGTAISTQTVAEYLELLKSMYLIEEVRGWEPPARSPKRLQTKPKRYFADPSLAVAALGMGARSLTEDWQTLGLVFENLCMRDLMVYARALPDVGFEPVRYYRDDSGLEADAIIEMADGRWAALEIKLSEDKVPQGVASLQRLRKKLVERPGARTRPPEFMAVVVGIGGHAYRAAEGIYVIPISTLGA